MILTLTNSEDATADYLLPILQSGGLSVVRLDTDSLITDSTVSFSTAFPVLTFRGKTICADQIRHIWYRRPERLRHVDLDESPESRFAVNEWSEAIEGFLAHISPSQWINHPAANVKASNKLRQLTMAKELGFAVPATLLSQDASAVMQFCRQQGGTLIAKPLSNGYIERGSGADSLIYTNLITEADIAEGSTDLASCPTLFQQCIPKRADVRITIIDDDFHAVELHALDHDGRQRCDIRRNNMEDVEYRRVDLPNHVEAATKRLVSSYGLRFAAIDMAITHEGNWVFFEVNPNGQWAWLDLSAGTQIAESFIRAFRDE